MIIVKRLSVHHNCNYMLSDAAVWRGCKFDFSSDCRKYDWLVVFDYAERAEKLACPPENTILVMTEPATVKIYPDNYLRQFGMVICPQERGFNRHPNMRYASAIWHWNDGFLNPDGGRMNYEEMLNLPPPSKSEWMSIVCSTKTFTDFHRRRFEFCSRLASEFSGIDFYGHGTRPIADKAETLLPHQFHLAVENLCHPDYWTEKIAEPLLAYSLPLYCGCPNMSELIPPESFIPIDIGDFESVAEIIRNCDAGEYARRLGAIREARHLLLTRHHPCNQIADCIHSGGDRTAENGGVIRTVNDCKRHSGHWQRWMFLWKKRRYKRLLYNRRT